MNAINLFWNGKSIQDLEPKEEIYVFYDSLQTAAGCDLVFILKVYVETIPITYSVYVYMPRRRSDI